MSLELLMVSAVSNGGEHLFREFPMRALAVPVPAEDSRREIGGHGRTCTPKAARFLSLDPLLFGLNHIPIEIGTPARTLTLISDVRSVALW